MPFVGGGGKARLLLVETPGAGQDNGPSLRTLVPSGDLA